MAKITDYPQAAALDGTEVVPLSQNGAQVQARTSQLAVLLSAPAAVAAAAAVGPLVTQVTALASAAQLARAAADADVVATGQNLALVNAAKQAFQQLISTGNPLGVVINGSGLQFETIGTAQLAQIPVGTKQITTLGFYAKNDGGAGVYKPVAANPNVGAGAFQSADGQWWQLLAINGIVNPRQTGAMGNAVYNANTGALISGNNDRQAFVDAEAALTTSPGNVLWSAGPEIRLDFGNFYMGGTTWEAHKRIRMIGVGTGYTSAGQGDVCQLIWNGAVCSIRLNSANTDGGVGVAFGSRGGSSDGTVLRGFGIVQLNTGFVAGAHGIDNRVSASLIDLTLTGIGDTAIYSITTSGGGGATEGASNHSKCIRCIVQQSFGDGMNLGGADSNVWLVEDLEVHSCAGTGIINTPYFVNTFINCLVNGYGNGGVTFNGNVFQLVVPGGGRQQPGSGGYWYLLGASSGANSLFPNWQPNTDYRMQAPVYSPGTASVFDGLYVESQIIFAIIGGLVWGSVTVLNTSSGAISFGTGYDEAKGAMIVQSGIGTDRKLYPGDQAYADTAGRAYALLGVRSSAGGVEVLRFGKSSEAGGNPWTWTNDGADQSFGQFNQNPTFQITGTNTTKTFGGPSPRPRLFGVPDLALYNYQDYYHTIFGARASFPRGPIGRGEAYINQGMQPGGFFGWCATTGGVAGSTAVINTWGSVSAAAVTS